MLDFLRLVCISLATIVLQRWRKHEMMTGSRVGWEGWNQGKTH